METTPGFVRSGTWSSAMHCSSTVSSSMMTRSPVAAISCKQRIGERGLAGGGTAGDQDVASRPAPPRRRNSACGCVRISSADVPLERITPTARLRMAKAGARTIGGSTPSKRSPRLRQFRGDDRRARHAPRRAHAPRPGE